MHYTAPMRRTLELRPNRTRLPKLLIGVIFGLGFLQVVVSNRLATTGIAIVDTERQIQDLTLSNNDLRQQIASASALLTVKEKAKALGFTKATKPVYYPNELPVAQVLR